ncbi:MAG TPA: hypothetical protein VKP67_00930 [Xanthobacteraceae bacterium]|nr:hypothetical protein [Xanthobacteraceae bacterium]
MSDNDPVRSWRKPPLEAASLWAGQCEACGRIVIKLEAADGAVFACGHIDRQQTQQMIEWLQKAMHVQ